MKRTSLIIFFCASVFTSMSITGCVETPKKQDDNRVYFKFGPVNKLILPVRLNDSITAELLFDTGGHFVLDNSFYTAHPSLVPYAESHVNPTYGSAWSFERDTALFYYDDIPRVKLGKTDLEKFNKMFFFRWKQYNRTKFSDGMFNIPESDTTNVWELNFENAYVEIHTESFTMPEDCFVFSMEQQQQLPRRFNIRLPLKLRFPDGDTLALDHLYEIDTGTTHDIALMYRAEELEFLNRREDAVWTETPLHGRYYRHYTADAVLLGDFLLDSLRIYTYDHPNYMRNNYLIGLNFLKRFNVFFDMKKRKVGLQPIKNYQRIINPYDRRFHFSTELTPDGKLMVSKLADYPGNYYKMAGIKEGDVIIAVNDTLVENIIEKENPELNNDTLIFDILRSGKPLKIIVPVDKNEVQGD